MVVVARFATGPPSNFSTPRLRSDTHCFLGVLSAQSIIFYNCLFCCVRFVDSLFSHVRVVPAIRFCSNASCPVHGGSAPTKVRGDILRVRFQGPNSSANTCHRAILRGTRQSEANYVDASLLYQHPSKGSHLSRPLEGAGAGWLAAGPLFPRWRWALLAEPVTPRHTIP